MALARLFYRVGYWTALGAVYIGLPALTGLDRAATRLPCCQFLGLIDAQRNPSCRRHRLESARIWGWSSWVTVLPFWVVVGSFAAAMGINALGSPLLYHAGISYALASGNGHDSHEFCQRCRRVDERLYRSGFCRWHHRSGARYSIFPRSAPRKKMSSFSDVPKDAGIFRSGWLLSAMDFRRWPWSHCARSYSGTTNFLWRFFSYLAL